MVFTDSMRRHPLSTEPFPPHELRQLQKDVLAIVSPLFQIAWTASLTGIDIPAPSRQFPEQYGAQNVHFASSSD